MIIARKTTRYASPALSVMGVPRPVYEGGRVPDGDRRVQLEDGRLCHVWWDTTGNEPLPILCTTLVAVNSGDNIVERRPAEEGDSAGLADAGRLKSHYVVLPLDGTVLGYYEEHKSTRP